MRLTKPDVDGWGWDAERRTQTGKLQTQQILLDSRGSGKGSPVPGFGVRAFESGVKSYTLKYRTRAGRTRLMTISPCTVKTLIEAREAAQRFASSVSDGGDPVEDRKQMRATRKTVAEFADEWLEGYAKSHRRSWAEDRRRIENRIKPAIGSKSLTDVTPADVAKLHHEIGGSAPVEANRTIQTVRLIFNTALSWGLLPENHRNPAQVRRGTYGGANGAVRTYQEKSRRVFVREDEMKGFLDAVDAEAMAPLFMLVLLTGSRKSEILGARRDNVNLKRGELTLGGTGLGQWRGAAKEGGRTVYLSDRAVEVIKGIENTGSPFLFPTPGKPDKALDPRARAIKGAWKRIRAASDLTHITLHDLRHTCGSWLLRGGWTELQIAEALGHESGGGTTRRYTHITPEQAREMMNDFAARLEAVRNPEPPRACPSCKATGHGDGAAFCSACGAGLEDSS